MRWWLVVIEVVKVAEHRFYRVRVIAAGVGVVGVAGVARGFEVDDAGFAFLGSCQCRCFTLVF